MSRSNWNLVLRAADMGILRSTERDTLPSTSTLEPFPWVCANRLCRASFMRQPYHSEYCPVCLGYLKAGRPDLLDPVVYAECQKIIAEECEANPNSAEYREWLRDREGYRMQKPRRNPKAVWRALIGLPPLLSDADVDMDNDFKGMSKPFKNQCGRGR